MITGGARGQGASHGRVCAEEGATVILADVLDEGHATAAELQEEGLNVHYRALDITDESAWISVVSDIEQNFGIVDGLVNNAGIVRLALPEDESADAFARILSVNTVGTFLGMKVAASAMRRGHGGSIVNIASVNAHMGVPAFFSYNASKAAVLNMTKSAAVAYADDGIRINSVSPGWLTAPMREEHTDSRVATDWRFGPVIAPKTLIKEEGKPRGAQPEEISAAVLFFLSNESSFVTGTDILVDGGARIW
ncbi:SDR family oxidoreductase [Mycetocola sp. 2940]|uniref:SDR family NAD(P)-dependent oxidoreductase n=1 Tax=Mycetocola sp. 2940 TaxID=3156452 RepID=UPI003399971E